MDDSILESGHKIARRASRLVFRGGTNETGVMWQQKRRRAQKRQRGARAGGPTGRVVEKTISKPANPGPVASAMRLVLAGQVLAGLRTTAAPTRASAVLEAIQAAKEEERETARAAAGEGFELLSTVCAERLPA